MRALARKVLDSAAVTHVHCFDGNPKTDLCSVGAICCWCGAFRPADLSAPKWRRDPDGVIVIESKSGCAPSVADVYRERDVLAYALYGGALGDAMSAMQTPTTFKPTKEVRTSIRQSLVSVLNRTIKGIRRLIFGFDPETIISLLEGITKMQGKLLASYNKLADVVNSFTTDLGAFVAHAKDEIAAQLVTINDLTDKLKAAIDGAATAATTAALAGLDEAATAIDSQVDRLASAHQSLTDFTVPTVTATTPDAPPPVVAAPVIDPTAAVVPPQPDPTPAGTS